MAMLVFIDDSGDPGFKLNKGSTKHFVIACVIFDDNLDAEETALKIKRYRRILNRHDNYEFKFNKLNKEYRLGFLNEIKDCKFRVRAIIADKSTIRSHELQNEKNKFYNYMIKEVLKKSVGSISNAKIRLDGHEDRTYKKEASAYFRKQVNLNGSIIKNMKFVDSKGDNLIQLADLISGSILRTTQNDKSDCNLYLEVLTNRIEDIWRFK